MLNYYHNLISEHFITLWRNSVYIQQLLLTLSLPSAWKPLIYTLYLWVHLYPWCFISCVASPLTGSCFPLLIVVEDNIRSGRSCLLLFYVPSRTSNCSSPSGHLLRKLKTGSLSKNKYRAPTMCNLMSYMLYIHWLIFTQTLKAGTATVPVLLMKKLISSLLCVVRLGFANQSHPYHPSVWKWVPWRRYT